MSIQNANLISHRSNTHAQKLERLVKKERGFRTSNSPSSLNFSYDALRDQHNSYYFEAPSVQKHLIKLKTLVSKVNHSESTVLSNNIEQIIKTDATKSKRGQTHKKIYISDCNQELVRFSKKYLRRMRKNSQIGRNSQKLPLIAHQTDNNETNKSKQYQATLKKEQKLLPRVQHSNFISFLNHKKMEVDLRKIYFQRQRIKTQ